MHPGRTGHIHESRGAARVRFTGGLVVNHAEFDTTVINAAMANTGIANRLVRGAALAVIESNPQSRPELKKALCERWPARRRLLVVLASVDGRGGFALFEVGAAEMRTAGHAVDVEGVDSEAAGGVDADREGADRQAADREAAGGVELIGFGEAAAEAAAGLAHVEGGGASADASKLVQCGLLPGRMGDVGDMGDTRDAGDRGGAEVTSDSAAHATAYEHAVMHAMRAMRPTRPVSSRGVGGGASGSGAACIGGEARRAQQVSQVVSHVLLGDQIRSEGLAAVEAAAQKESGATSPPTVLQSSRDMWRAALLKPRELMSESTTAKAEQQVHLDPAAACACARPSGGSMCMCTSIRWQHVHVHVHPVAACACACPSGGSMCMCMSIRWQ